MKIGIDCRLWNETGVGRYIRNLVENLILIDKKNDYVLFVRSRDQEEIKFTVHNSKFIIHTTDIKWHTLGEQVLFPRILNEQNLDLVHFPYFSVPVFYNKPYVVTLHDLIVQKFSTGRASTLPYPLYLAKRLGYKAVLKNAVRKSKKIMVPSFAVKQDLMDEYKFLPEGKILVTYEGGFDFNIKNKKLNIKGIEEGKYFVRVGNYYPHKNVEHLLMAFKMLINDFETRNTKLVLVGKKDFFFKRIEKIIKSWDLTENVIFRDNITDDELLALYKNSIATVVPSFMEGFSLTAVEALSAESPVVASDIPVHREVCADTAIYFDPHDINDIKQKLNHAFMLTKESRAGFIEEGKKRAEKFSWDEMAKETLLVYNSVI